MKKQIVNIVNFIRACEPRMPMDLYTPVVEQARLMQKYKLRGTFLLQYDALLDARFIDFLKTLNPEQFEFGVWHEIVQPETEACGIPWTGRFPWDWHVHCGFSVGYTKEQREQLADALFEKFRAVFGYYPRVFGSWLFDSHTLRYLSDKYGLDAVCNCKEQYGTDGYTLWGAYYGQAYYPARTNCFMPAQTAEEQLPVPLFRMLGSDPVYQYDFGLDVQNGADRVQGVVTLEPVYTGSGTGGGGVPEWVDWFLSENYNGDCLTFGYAQAGQENSFGWEAMGDGLSYQFRRFAELRDAGRLTVEPLGETGRWYKETYSATPASAITAHSAFNDPDKSSVWYSGAFYRANLYCDHGMLRIRDLHVFSERYRDPFEDTVCTANEATYETLPIADGNRHSGNGVLAGLYIEDAQTGEPIPADPPVYRELGDDCVQLDCGTIRVTLKPRSLRVTCSRPFRVVNRIGKTDDHIPTVEKHCDKAVALSYDGVPYKVRLTAGSFADERTVLSENGAVEAEFYA